MRIAIAHWQGRVSPVFDVSDRLLIIDIKKGREKRRQDISMRSHDPFERAKEVSSLTTDVLLCGAISKALETSLRGMGVQVDGFICGNLEEVIAAFISGQLEDPRFRMPGRHS